MIDHPHERRGEIGGTRRPGHHEARWRHVLWRVDWIWRRVVPLFCLGIAMVVLFRIDDKADRTQVQVDAQAAGRQVAREILCGGLNGASEAGRLVLLGELPPPAPPSPQLSSVERDVREAYGESYATVISKSILDQVGVEAKGVIRRDGSLNCDALNRLARTP
jgi:hypothetical protein